MNCNIIVRNYETPCGTLILGAYDGKLCLCDWLGRKNGSKILYRLTSRLQSFPVSGNDDVLDLTVRELDDYFSGKRNSFSIPLLLVGTQFQVTIWETLKQIQFGTTVSYKTLAEMAGKAQSIRAVANAVGANALSIIIPCHRIIGSDGTLTGYAGGLDAKKYLLSLESN